MSRFIEHALNLLGAAQGSLQSGERLSDMTIVITGEGSIRMMAGSDWALEALCNHYGAQAVYRVSEQQSRVRVEGREASGRCLFESEAPRGVAHRLLNSQPIAYLAA